MIDKYLIYSDSHGASDPIFNAIEHHHASLSGILFLGDGAKEAMEVAHCYAPLPFYGVTGNNDFLSPKEGKQFPLERLVTLEGATLYLTHGHITQYAKVQSVVAERADAAGATIALYGHLHMPYAAEHEGVLLINPGSIAYPRGGSRASYLCLSIDTTKTGRDAISWQFYSAEEHQPITIAQ